MAWTTGIARAGFVGWLLYLLLFSHVYADDAHLMDLRVRLGLSGSSPLGEEQQSDFQQYEVATTIALPWSWYSRSGWGVGTRVTVSGGALRGAGETGFIGTLVPAMALGSADGRVSVDIGGGGALLSRRRYGGQDFGGPFQFVWSMGLSVPVYRSIGLGYRFQHYSDATIYGQHSRGVDLHMIEVVYRY